MTTHLYSFDLSNFEDGKFTATRHPHNRAVGGDWVCFARTDAEAEAKAQDAALEEWCSPKTREPQDFTVDFQDA